MTLGQRARYPIVAAVAGATVAGLWLTTHSPASFVVSLGATWLAAWVVLCVRSRTPLRLAAMRFAAVHLALLVLVGLLEIPALLGMVDYRLVFAVPIVSPSRDPRFLPDPELVYIAAPHDRRTGDDGLGNIACVYEVPDRETHAFDVRCDARGFRNRVTLDRADVAVVGDSFVANDYVFDGYTATSVLERRLRVPVCNLAQRGYGPQQEAVVVRRFAITLHPKVVVWVFFEGNDLEDVYGYRDIMADLPAARAARHGFAARSFTRNVLESLMYLVGNPRDSALPLSAWWTAPGRRERVYFLDPLGPLPPRSLAALDDVAGILAGTAKLCDDAGARFVVAFAPDKFRACRRALEFEPGAEPARWTVNDLPERLAAIVRGLPGGAKFVDLTPALAASSDAGDLPYFRDDTHWNNSGNRVVADTLAAALRPLLGAPVVAASDGGLPEGPR